MRLGIAITVSLAILIACADSGKWETVNTTYFFANTFSLTDLQVPDNHIILGIDNSNSMAEEIQALKPALRSFLNNIPADVKYTLRVFSLNDSWTAASSTELEQEELARQYGYRYGARRFHPSVKIGTHANLNDPLSFVDNLTTSNHNIEPFLSMFSVALQNAFGGYKIDGKLDNAHLVVMSDEDATVVWQSSTSGDRKALIKEQNGKRYMYDFNYTPASSRVLIQSNQFCVRDASVGYDPTVAGKALSCADTHGTSFIHSWNEFAKYVYTSNQLTTNRYESCLQPQTYLCEIVRDGNTFVEEMSDYRTDSNCTPKDSTLKRSFFDRWNTAEKNNPYKTACEWASCHVNAYTAYRLYDQVDRPGGVITPIYDGCSPGYTQKDGFTYKIFDKVESSPIVQSPLPTGVWRVPNTVIKDYFYADHVLSPEEEIAHAVARQPQGSGHVIVSRPVRPASPDEVYDTMWGNAEGFTAYKNRFFKGARVFFHSIVNLNGMACSGDTGINNTRGTEYLKLSNGFPKGETGTICDPSTSLNNFLSKLQNSIVLHNDPSFMLEADVDFDKGELYIELLKSKRVLQPGEYELINHRHLTLSKELPLSGEEVRVEFRPKK